MEKTFEGPQISFSDCQKAITKKLKTTNFKILKYQQIPFEEINGYLGEHCVLEITIERNKSPETHYFFIKFPPQVKSQLNFLTEINGIFKEKNFFTKYIPLLKNHKINTLDNAIPECYHISQGTFILEDLKSRGFDTLPSRIPLDLNHVKAALTTFAKLHSSGLILEEIKKIRLTDEFEIELKESFYLGTDSTERAMKSSKQGIKALIDITHQDNMKISKELFKKSAIEGCDLQKEFTKPSKKFRNTLCHADPWTKNFLFKKHENGISCVIVDFQTYRYGPPAQDVMAFIYLVTNRNLREDYLNEILEFYYSELSRNFKEYGLEGVITRDEFFESCDYFKQFALTQTLTHFQVVILSDEIGKELFGNQDKARDVLFRDKYDFIQMVCQRDEVFMARNFEAITDLREFFEMRKSSGYQFV